MSAREFEAERFQDEVWDPHEGEGWCLFCKQWKPDDECEDTPDGSVCATCGQHEKRQCAGCLRTHALREYVTNQGVSPFCADCEPEVWP